MENTVTDFQIFVKPVGALCNLKCNYCYYLGKKSLYKNTGSPLMSDEILEKYIIQHFKATSDKIINFLWHGGEPLLAGLDFFNKVIDFQNRNKPPGSTIVNGIQTNGTLIDDSWASFLSEHNFIVGISIDGPGDLHNMHRKTADRRATLGKVIRSFEILNANGVQTEILCVVHSENVKYPLVVYDFFRQLGTKFITFLPLVEKIRSEKITVSKSTVPSIEFGYFLCEIFNEWLAKDIGNIKIQIFEEAIRLAFNQEHTLCIFKKECGRVPLIEHNGDFYSCDHFVGNSYLIGNIGSGTISDFLEHEKQKAFGKAKLLSLPGYCKQCEVRPMCNGECPKNRFINSPDGEPGLNYLCGGYKIFFNHCKPLVETIAMVWKNQR